jgi:hypothetical protein
MHLCHCKDHMIKGSLGDTMYSALGYYVQCFGMFAIFNFWTFNSTDLFKYGIIQN